MDQKFLILKLPGFRKFCKLSRYFARGNLRSGLGLKAVKAICSTAHSLVELDTLKSPANENRGIPHAIGF